MSFLFVTMRSLVNDAGRYAHAAPAQGSAGSAEQVRDDEAPSVEHQAMSEHELERLCIAIAELPERIRHAFVLRRVYGYSCREIAEQLGRSTNTVREQVAQGFKRLRYSRNGDGPSGICAGREPDKSAAEETTAMRSVTAPRLIRRGSSS